MFRWVKVIESIFKKWTSTVECKVLSEITSRFICVPAFPWETIEWFSFLVSSSLPTCIHLAESIMLTLDCACTQFPTLFFLFSMPKKRTASRRRKVLAAFSVLDIFQQLLSASLTQFLLSLPPALPTRCSERQYILTIQATTCVCDTHTHTDL